MSIHELEHQADEGEEREAPTARMLLPSIHLGGDGTWGVQLQHLGPDEDRLALKVPMTTPGGFLAIYGTRHQLLQFTSELATVVEIGLNNT